MDDNGIIASGTELVPVESAPAGEAALIVSDVASVWSRTAQDMAMSALMVSTSAVVAFGSAVYSNTLFSAAAVVDISASAWGATARLATQRPLAETQDALNEDQPVANSAVSKPNIIPVRSITNFDKAEPSRVMPPMLPGERIGFIKSSDTKSSAGELATRYYVNVPFGAHGRTPVLLLVQGKGTSIEYYLGIMRAAAAKGYIVVSYDLLSQGLSARQTDNPQTTHIRSFVQYQQQLCDVKTKIIDLLSSGPLVIAGDSTGGLISFLSTAEGLVSPDRLVGMSPLIRLNLSVDERVAKNLAKGGRSDAYFLRGMAGHGNDREVDNCLNPQTQAAWLANNRYSFYHPKIIRVAEGARRDQRFRNGGPSNNWVFEIIEAYERLNAMPAHPLAPEVRFGVALQDLIVDYLAVIHYAHKNVLGFLPRRARLETSLVGLHAKHSEPLGLGSPEMDQFAVDYMTLGAADLAGLKLPPRPDQADLTPQLLSLTA